MSQYNRNQNDKNKKPEEVDQMKIVLGIAAAIALAVVGFKVHEWWSNLSELGRLAGTVMLLSGTTFVLSVAYGVYNSTIDSDRDKSLLQVHAETEVGQSVMLWSALICGISFCVLMAVPKVNEAQKQWDGFFQPAKEEPQRRR